MSDVLRAASHQQSESRSVTGPNSYDSGAGFSVRSDLGRVDEVIVHAGEDDATKPFDATAEVADNNAVVISVFSQDSGNEAEDDTDLSSITFRYTAERL